jgi:hypothetical protein
VHFFIALTILQQKLKYKQTNQQLKVKYGVIEMPQKEFSQSRAYINRNLPDRRKKPSGGTIINITTAVIFFGLIGLGVWWVLKTLGEESEQYTEAMVNTQHKAISLKCQTNLRTIWQNLQIYALSNEKFPESQEELEQWSGNSKLFQCPDPEGEKYIYIPGEKPDMPPQNILVYEPKAVHDGLCNVLRLNGQIESLTPEELQAALAQTMKTFR